MASSSLPCLKLVCLIALVTANLFAAGPAGGISGLVTDPQGAAVAHVQIKVNDQKRSDCPAISKSIHWLAVAYFGLASLSVTTTWNT